MIATLEATEETLEQKSWKWWHDSNSRMGDSDDRMDFSIIISYDLMEILLDDTPILK